MLTHYKIMKSFVPGHSRGRVLYPVDPVNPVCSGRPSGPVFDPVPPGPCCPEPPLQGSIGLGVVLSAQQLRGITICTE